ncbi:hypothetical protein JCM11251_002594 [Rhodosporidiobolus azoricus]
MRLQAAANTPVTFFPSSALLARTSPPSANRSSQFVLCSPSDRNHHRLQFRRSQVELLEQLNSLFDSLPSGSRPTSPILSLPDGFQQNQPRTAPLRLLPELFAAFEQKRGIQLLTVEEKAALLETVNSLPEDMQNDPVGVGEVLGLLMKLGVAGNSSSSSSSSEVDEPPQSTTPLTSPAFTRPPSLRNDPFAYTTPTGSPVPRHRRTTSNSSLTSLSPSSANSAIPSLAFPPSSTTSQQLPSGTTPNRRRSLLSSLSRSSPSTSKGLRKRRTFEDLSALVVQQGGTYLGVPLDGPTGEGKGEGKWDVEALAEKVKGVVTAKALNRDRDLAYLLSPLTYPQLKALDSTYLQANGKSLPEVVTGEKVFKGNFEYGFRGLLMGPLGWDVWLLQKALEGATTNDTLLIDLLVSRTPSDLALLRAAYSSRSSPPPRTPSAHSVSSSALAASPSPASTNLNVAVLSAFSSNIRLRKAWEVTLQGRWEDCPDGEEEQVAELSAENKDEREERRQKLLREDLDQLKVALRRGGNIEIVSKILLARSPAHLHHLIIEYRRNVTAGHSSLTKAIKQCIPAGTLQKLFLHAVEGAKNVGEGEGAREGKDGRDGFGSGVWRDAKALERAMEVEKGGKREELLWRLLRLHWDRPRFLAVQQAFKQKYRKTISDRLSSALPAGVLVDLTTSLVKSASLPEPTPTAQDQHRLLAHPLTEEDTANRSRKSSVNSLVSMPEQEEDPRTAAPTALDAGGEVDSECESFESESSSPGRIATESGELEAEGELSDPPSPRSPPVQSEFEFEMDDQAPGQDVEEAGRSEQATPMLSALARVETPTAPHSSTPPESGRSASTDWSTGSRGKSHANSSSLSYRQRTAPLEFVGTQHRPPSSAGGSADSAKLSSSSRHSRPIAPSRAKRRQSDQPRAESEEPLSPSLRGEGRGFTSPTPSTPSRGQSRAGMSRSVSSSNGESLDSSVGSTHSAAIGMGNASMVSSIPEDSFFGSPPTSIDTTSFHATPLSPNQPHDQISSSFFPGQTPPPSSPPAFDLSAAASDFFATSHLGGTGTPDSSPEYHFSSFLRRQGSNLSHLSSTSSGNDGGASRASSLFAGDGGLGLPVSIFEGSPAGHLRDGSGGMSGGGEQVQQLLRHTNELMRKLKESEARFQVSASAFEEQVSDLQDRLEEVRAELQTKRREEKELRIVEKEHLVQINSLEADVAKLTKSLERSRESYDAMKRNYTATCEEAERLRALVAETRRENRAADEAIQNHALQVQQFERDRDLLQQTINRLEEDLGVARRAQDSLDDQKQENLLLKETIDKLRFEIDEMRANARKSQLLDGPMAPGSPAKSLAESLSKSLGREIAKQMAAQQDGSDSSDEGEDTAGEEDEVDDIVVTTHRRIKKRSKKSSPATAKPVVTRVQTSVHVCDVDVQTDLTPVREMDVQTDLSAINIDLVAAPAVEPEVIVVEPLPPVKTPQEMQVDLAKELGINVDLVKQFVDASKSGKAPQLVANAASPPLASPRRSGRWRQRIPMAHAPSVLVNDPQAFPNSARPYVAQVLDSSISLVLYSATFYLLGVVTGSRFLPVNHHHTFAPFQVMFSSQDSSHNTINWEGLTPGHGGSGYASEGLSDLLFSIVWSGTRIARRIPV